MLHQTCCLRAAAAEMVQQCCRSGWQGQPAELDQFERIEVPASCLARRAGSHAAMYVKLER